MTPEEMFTASNRTLCGFYDLLAKELSASGITVGDASYMRESSCSDSAMTDPEVSGTVFYEALSVTIDLQNGDFAPCDVMLDTDADKLARDKWEPALLALLRAFFAARGEKASPSLDAFAAKFDLSADGDVSNCYDGRFDVEADADGDALMITCAPHDEL